MDDLQGNLQEIRRFIERSEKANEERKKEAKIKYLENLRDSIALTVMEKLLLVVPDCPLKYAEIADMSYAIADAMMYRKLTQPPDIVNQCGEGDSETAWHQGPPPARDDGKMILVRLSPEGYDGNPVWAFVARCYSRGVSTVNGSEWAYSSVASWCEIPR